MLPFLVQLLWIALELKSYFTSWCTFLEVMIFLIRQGLNHA